MVFLKKSLVCPYVLCKVLFVLIAILFVNVSFVQAEIIIQNASTTVSGDVDDAELILSDDLYHISLERTDFSASWTSLSSGFNHVCSIGDSTSVYCWGDNSDGQLGDDTNVDSVSLRRVLDGEASGGDSSGGYLTNMDIVRSGNGFSCALNDGGSVYCWGDNQYGQLGNDTVIDSDTPVKVVSGQAIGDDVSGGYLTNIISIAVGEYHVCVVSNQSYVYCWGSNSDGQLGNGEVGGYSDTPEIVLAGDAIDDDIGGGFVLAALSNVITAGENHVCIVSSQALVYCWGDNQYGQLGDGTEDDRNTPGIVLAGEAFNNDYFINVIEIDETEYLTGGYVSAGDNHTCLAGAAVYCWGDNQYGQLGVNDHTNYDMPKRVLAGEALFIDTINVEDVSYLEGASFENGYGILSLTRGQSCLTGIDTAAIYCWGDNEYGQLGNNSTSSSPTPIQVSVSENILAGDITDGKFYGAIRLSGGDGFICALSANGNIYCWGDNEYGTLGNENFDSYSLDPMWISKGQALNNDYAYVYSQAGTYSSQVINISDFELTTVDYSANVPEGTTLTVYLSFADNEEMEDSEDVSLVYPDDELDISEYSDYQYLVWSVALESDSSSYAPTLYEININGTSSEEGEEDTPPVVVSGGGSAPQSGGGGSSYRAPVSQNNNTGANGCTSGNIFNIYTGIKCPVNVVLPPAIVQVRDLEFGNTGQDVKALQILLISLGYPILAGPTGSFFGQTRSALSQYQKDKSIVPAVGYFGPITRKVMKDSGVQGLWW